jgi:Leucine-rich repeat (LRR) protein
MTILDLGGCNLRGSIEVNEAGKSIFSSAALAEFHVEAAGGGATCTTRQGIGGKLPADLASATNLKVLGLGCNAFTGTLTMLASLTKLTQVAVDFNFFTGPLPSFAKSAASLAYISVANNNFTGTVPESWKALSKLKTMGLPHNTLSGSIDWLITKDVLPALTVCFIRDNIFTGTIPGKLPLNLSVFDADKNNFSAIDPAICTSPVPAFENAGGCASDWPNQPFKTCCFGSITCNSTSSLPSCVIENCGVNCVALEELSAWQGLYDATNGPLWKKCSDARSDPCSCSYSDPSGYSAGVKCKGGHITYVQLYGNNLLGTIPSSLANLSKLTQLYLYGNQLKGLLPPLPFAQYTDNGYGDGCFLDDPSDCTEPNCNHFKCPLPAGHKRCKYNAYHGVHCK